MVQHSLAPADTLSFQAFLDPSKVQSLFVILEKRRITPGRIYILTLVIMKVLNFVADFAASQSFSVPVSKLSTWHLVRNASRMWKVSETQRVISNKLAGPIAGTMLTVAEMSVLLKCCQTWLQDHGHAPKKVTSEVRKEYAGHLISALFVSVPPPRVQVLQKLKMDKTFFFDGSVYYFRFDGIDPPLKSRKPLVLVVPDHLTGPFQVWLEYYRPQSSNLIFPSNSGKGPRRNWSSVIQMITQRYLKKSFTPRMFR